MATYKVLQDIEAEDKLFGPFTLKQFIFAAITIVIGFVQFTIITSGAPTFIKIPMIFVLLPPLLVFGFLAAPIGQDQPNDIWLFARLRFLLKPHRRIWNQDGISELVTVTAPKKEIHIYTNGLSQTEVSSRLEALASTLDSRGWAVKNVNTNLFAQPGYLTSQDASSDRLVDPSSLPQDVPVADVLASDDIMDPLNNTTAQHLDQLVQASTQAVKQQAISQMKQDPAQAQQKPADYWFMNQTTPSAPLPQNLATFTSQQVVAPGTTDVHPAAQATADEEALAERLASQRAQTFSATNDHMKTIQPLHDKEGKIIKKPQPVMPAPEPATPATVAPPTNPQPQRQEPPNPAILELANNDDLNVATIARQAKRLSEDDGEVVISLH